MAPVAALGLCSLSLAVVHSTAFVAAPASLALRHSGQQSCDGLSRAWPRTQILTSQSVHTTQPCGCAKCKGAHSQMTLHMAARGAGWFRAAPPLASTVLHKVHQGQLALRRWVTKHRQQLLAAAALLVVTFVLTTANPAFASSIPRPDIPDLEKFNPGEMPLHQWLMRDQLKKIVNHPSTDMTNYEIPGGREVIEKFMWGNKMRSTMGEQIGVEARYYKMIDVANKRYAAVGGTGLAAGLVAVILTIGATIYGVIRFFATEAQTEEKELYGEELNVDATEVEPEEVKLSDLDEDDEADADSGADDDEDPPAAPVRPSSPRPSSPSGGSGQRSPSPRRAPSPRPPSPRPPSPRRAPPAQDDGVDLLDL